MLEGALALATRTGRAGRAPRSGLGFLELTIEDYPAAWGWLEPAIDRIVPLGLLSPTTTVSDSVEALARTGQVDEAARLLAVFEEPARRLDRRWALAAAARCRGFIREARDDLAGAERELEEAVEIGRPLPMPFELGRSLLALGSVRRRLRRKQTARATLDEAFDVLEGLGAVTWAARARRESARIGGRPPRKGDLSSTEEQIADLVGMGRTNKEIALALQLSVKTVEWNLTRVYRKLGVDSRTELTIARSPKS
jgi:DNA-binding CsgD family transcriptional regulator